MPSPSITVRILTRENETLSHDDRVGSLVARIVFQPIEEMGRVFFSKVLSDPSTQGQNRKSLQQASSALLSLVNVQLSFTVILAAFGPLYMSIALQILLPQQYFSTSAPSILSAWIWYIPVLAVNGGLEAFVSSAATTDDLNRQSRYAIRSSSFFLTKKLTYEKDI
jgi:oligosaccharide translocation protein RFT1